jgi:ABC-type transporter MlaC component
MEKTLPIEIIRRYTQEELEDFFEKYINTIDKFYIISKIDETEMKSHMSYMVPSLLAIGTNGFKTISFDKLWKFIRFFENGLFEYYKDRIIDYCKTYGK